MEDICRHNYFHFWSDSDYSLLTDQHDTTLGHHAYLRVYVDQANGEIVWTEGSCDWDLVWTATKKRIFVSLDAHRLNEVDVATGKVLRTLTENSHAGLFIPDASRNIFYGVKWRRERCEVQTFSLMTGSQVVDD